MATLTYFGFGAGSSNGGEGGTLSVPHGTLAQRPSAAASNEGSTYFAENDTTGGDDGTLYYSTGTEWIVLNRELGTVGNRAMPGDRAVELIANKNTPGGYRAIPTSGPEIPILAKDIAVSAVDGSTRHMVGFDGSLPDGERNLFRSINTEDLVTFLLDDIWGSEEEVADGVNCLVKPGWHLPLAISRKFPKLNEIASVGWYVNDSALVSGSKVPTKSAFSTRTSVPFSLGGSDTSSHITPADLSSASPNYGIENTISVLVTYKDGSKEVATTRVYPFNNIGIHDVAASGSVARGYYRWTSYTLNPATQVVKEANDGQVCIVGLVNEFFTDGVTTNASTTFTSASASFTSGDNGRIIEGPGILPGTTVTYVNSTTVTLSQAATASATGIAFTIFRSAQVALTGSKLTHKGDFLFIGNFNPRRADMQWISAEGRRPLTFSFPPHLADDYPSTSSEGRSRCIQLDGISGGRCQRPVLSGVRIRSGISDGIAFGRASDVRLSNVSISRLWDLHGGAHFDGVQLFGDVIAEGTLKDSENEEVAILMENMDVASNILLKPDLGSVGKITMDRVNVHDSPRVGVEIWNHPTGAGDSLVIEQIKTINCHSWNHANWNYRSTSTGGGTLVPVIDRSNTLVNSPVPTTDVFDAPPADYQNIDRPIVALDARSNSGLSATASVNLPGTRNLKSLVMIVVRLSDPTIAPPTSDATSGVVRQFDSGAGDGVSPRFAVYRTFWTSNTPSAFSFALPGSCNWRATAMTFANVDQTNPFDEVQYNSTGTAQSSVVTDTIRTQGRGRMVFHCGSITDTSAQGTWSKLSQWATQMNTQTVGQVSNTAGGSLAMANANAGDVIAYWPFPMDVSSGAKGPISIPFTHSGKAAGLIFALRPAFTPKTEKLKIRNLTAMEIPSEVSGLKSQTVGQQINELVSRIGEDPYAVEETSVVLGENAIYKGFPREKLNHSLFAVSSSSDVAYTLTIEESDDASDASFTARVVVPSVDVGSEFQANTFMPLIKKFVRVVITNGATPQTTSRIDVSLV